MSAFRLCYRVLFAVIGSALVMQSWSEFVFYNEEPAEALLDAIAQGLLPAIGFVIEMTVFYAVPSTLLVGLVAIYGSRGTGRVMAIGALTGCAIEGTVVAGVYEAVPFSYLWTSIAWHGPITVGLGVFILPRLMGKAGLVKMLLSATLLGAAWAIWTTWPWGDGYAPPSAGAFQLFALGVLAQLAVGYGLLWCAGWPDVTLPRRGALLLCLPSALFFILQGIGVPLLALGLFVILAALIAALRFMGPASEGRYRVKPANTAALALMTLIAVLAYGQFLTTGAPLPTEDLVALVFMIGLLTWGYGLIRGLWKRGKD